MKAGVKSETNSAGVFILEVFFLLKSRFFLLAIAYIAFTTATIISTCIFI